MNAERGGHRRGLALLLTVVALLGLGLLAHGALLLARQEAAASESAQRVLQARIGGEAAVIEALSRSLPSDTVRRLLRIPVLVGARRGLRYEAYAVRLGPEAFLLEGVGRAPGAHWGLAVWRLAWAMDPAARIGAFGGLVEVGSGSPVEIEGTADPAFQDWDDPLRSECDTLRASLDSMFPGPTPVVATVTEHPLGEPSLGRLSSAHLFASLDAPPGGRGTPSPAVSMGRCETARPWNWGDPDPGRPCSDHLVGLATTEPLRLEGGVGQGLLVTEGPLELAGTRWRGLILAGGIVTLSDGARLEGLVRAYGGIRVEAASTLSRGACAALVALDRFRDRLSVPVALRAGWLGPGGRAP